MSTTAPPPPKKPRRTKDAKLKGAGAIAQGKKARAAGKRGVVVDGPVGGNVTTGDTTYQTIIHQAAEPGASARTGCKTALNFLSFGRSLGSATPTAATGCRPRPSKKCGIIISA